MSLLSTHPHGHVMLTVQFPTRCPGCDSSKGGSYCSVHARVRVINRAMRIQGHYGRCSGVGKQLTPSVRTPIDVFFTVWVKTSWRSTRSHGSEPRCVQGPQWRVGPFLSRPPMGRASRHGEFCGGAGRQRVPQLYCWGLTVDCTSPNTVLWEWETQLRVNGVDE